MSESDDIFIICPSKYYYLNQETYTKPLKRGETIPVYVPQHEVTPDGKHKYHCFAITTKITDDFSELKEPDQRWLEHLGIHEVPVLAKIICLSENYIPLHRASAYISKVHPDDNLSINAVGMLKSPPNYISYEQFFKDKAIFIKTLDNMRLYFLGYHKPHQGNPRLVRFYTPKTTTDKHYYHMQIIRSVQARLPEAVYKRLRETLKLRIQGEQLVFNISYPAGSSIITEVQADFTVPAISKCIENFDELAKDPAGFIIACYAEIVKNTEVVRNA